MSPLSVVTVIDSAPSTTWLFVTIMPFSSITQPEPAPSSVAGPKKGLLTVTVVLMATTEGFTSATTSAILGRGSDAWLFTVGVHSDIFGFFAGEGVTAAGFFVSCVF